MKLRRKPKRYTFQQIYHINERENLINLFEYTIYKEKKSVKENTEYKLRKNFIVFYTNCFANRKIDKKIENFSIFVLNNRFEETRVELRQSSVKKNEVR